MALGIRVWQGPDKFFGVGADLTWTFARLKVAVEAAAGIPIREQRIFVDEYQRPDASLLRDELQVRDGLAQVTMTRRTPELADWNEAITAGEKTLNSETPSHILDDEEIVMNAGQRDGLTLQHASKVLRKNRKVVLNAVRQNGDALQYANTSLREDVGLVKEAVRQKGTALRWACEALQDDFIVVYDAVSQDGWALRYASEGLSWNREIVMAAAMQCGSALVYANGRCRSSPNELAHDEEELGFRADRGVMLSGVRSDGLSLQLASRQLRADAEIVLAAVRQNGEALRFADESLRNDRRMCLVALGKSPCPKFNASWAEICLWHKDNPDQ